MGTSGISAPVAKAQVSSTIKSGVTKGTQVMRKSTVQSTFRELYGYVRESLVHFGYELVRVSDGLLLAEGETTHIVTDAQMKTRTIPEKYMTLFREASGKTG